MTLLIWFAFIALVVGLIALDLGVFHRGEHVFTLGEALAWSLVWVTLALAFNVAVYFLYAGAGTGWHGLDTGHLTGGEAALQFLTGYLVEKSLSLDNIFVIAMIMAYFQVPLAHQHRLLFWGVIGAVVMRAVMIALGAALLARFDWMVYVFGVLLLASAGKMLATRHDNIAPKQNPVIRWLERLHPVSTSFHGGRFFAEEAGRRVMTPLLPALVLIETSDLMFALDSIPAIFAVTRDPFLVFTSNVFALLGLRALYFALAGLMHRFRYLKMSLVFLLAYVGVKMMLVHHYPIPTGVSLAIMGGILFVGVAASVVPSGPDTARLLSPLRDELDRLVTSSYHTARRILVLVFGSTLVLLGLAMLVLPGPGVLVIIGGLLVLGVEYAFARRWLAQLRATTDSAGRRMAGLLARWWPR